MNAQEIIPAHLLADKDVVEIKTFAGENLDMREFLAKMFAYQPAWISFLFRVRGVFVRFLGMKQEGIPHAVQLSAAEVPMKEGENMNFFRVVCAEEGHFWFAKADDSHLSAWLGVVMGGQKLYVITLVKYHNWRGPAYFNLIRPFHHVVVNRMVQAGLAS